MAGTQRYVYNKFNSLVSALAASGFVRGIEGAVLERPVARFGSSSIDITGVYTGQEEADYEFEILSTTPGANPLISKPVFTGKGTGSINGITFTSPLVAQIFTIELNDLGMILRAASVDLFDNLLRARTSGAVGNTLNLKVNRSGLIFTPQQFSLINDLSSGASAVEGAAFEWDSKLLLGDGTIPLNAHRVSFGTDTNNIYLMYKSFQAGKTEYNFIPAIKQTVQKGTIVNFVTGTYSVGLYNSATLVETFTGITTLYDFLDKVKNQSQYITVDTIVAFDRTPAGSASVEFPLNTDAYVQSNSGTGSSYSSGFIDVSIQPTAPTELVVATCFAANFKDDSRAGLGAELWRVEGSVTGLISPALVSGELYNQGSYEFRIPRKVPEGFAETRKGEFTVSSINYVTRTPLEPIPPICPTSLTLGVNASDQTITLTYKKKPIDNSACACDFLPGAVFDPLCLGLEAIAQGVSNMSYQADTVTKLIAFYTWLAETVRSNTKYEASSQLGSNYEIIGTNASIILGNGGRTQAFIETPASTLFKKSLLDIAKTFEKTIAELDKIKSLVDPLRIAGMAAWDAAVVELQDDIANELSLGISSGSVPITSTAVAGEALSSGDIVVIYNDGTADTAIKARSVPGIKYMGYVNAAFTAGATATVRQTGSFTVSDYGDSSSPTCTADTASHTAAFLNFYSSVCLGKLIYGNVVGPGTGAALSSLYSKVNFYQTSSNTAPYTVQALQAVGSGVEAGKLNLIHTRYETRLLQVYITAGISPLGKSNANTDSGDGCWQDSDNPFYWAVDGSVGGGYAPAYSNIPYVASKYRSGQVVNGVVVPQTKGYFTTKEFAFIINVKCPEQLKVEDQVVLVIGNSAYPSTYQVGDTLILEVISAQNLNLSGGNDGDNIQTWNVTGSIAGPLLPYYFNPASPGTLYNSGNGLGFVIAPGVISFDKTDKFEFVVEGGTFRKRRISGGSVGAWGGTLPILDSNVTLDSGLSYKFILGASPSFALGDVYKFTALQPYAISNLKVPSFERWEWGAQSAVVQDFDLGSLKNIDTLAFAFHTLDAGGTIIVRGANVVGPFDWSYNLTVKKDVFKLFLPVLRTARYLQIEVNGQSGKGIGWFFAGTWLDFTYSATVEINKKYSLQKAQNDFNPSAYFKGKGTGGQVVYPEGYIAESDLEPLSQMVDYLKENNNQPFLFSPQFTREDDFIVTVDSDNVSIQDIYGFQPNQDAERRMSATLPLTPVYFR